MVLAEGVWRRRKFGARWNGIKLFVIVRPQNDIVIFLTVVIIVLLVDLTAPALFPVGIVWGTGRLKLVSLDIVLDISLNLFILE